MREYVEKSVAAAVTGAAGLGLSLADIQQWLQILVLIATLIGTIAPTYFGWKASRKRKGE